VQHGYCVARHSCLESSNLCRADLVQGPPWNPIPERTQKAQAAVEAPLDSYRGATQTTITARLLERSKQRIIWSRLLDWRDWVSYLYLPLVLLMVLIGPYLALQVYRLYQANSQKHLLLGAIASGSEDYTTVSRLLEIGPPQELGDKYQLTDEFLPVDYAGFDMISETQVYDQRQNVRQDVAGTWSYYTHRRYRVARIDADHPLTLRFRVDGKDPRVRCTNRSLHPQFRRLKRAADEWSYWELTVDLAKLTADEPVDIVIETLSTKSATEGDRQDWTLEIMPPAPFGIISMWVLLPKQSYFTGFDLYERTSPDDRTLHRIQPTTGNTRSSGSVISWSLVNPEAGHIYQCHWVQAYANALQNSLRALSSP
jgi:hypothetical protein